MNRDHLGPPGTAGLAAKPGPAATNANNPQPVADNLHSRATGGHEGKTTPGVG